MANFTIPQLCTRTTGLKRYKNIRIVANQTKNNDLKRFNYNQIDSVTTTGSFATSSIYAGPNAPRVVRPFSENFPFYLNANNAGMLLDVSEGRTFATGTGTAVLPFVYDTTVYDTVEVVVMSSVAGKAFTVAISDSASNVLTFSGTIATANTPTRFIWKTNTVGTIPTTSQAGGGTTSGDPITGNTTNITFGSSGTGTITFFDGYVATHQLLLPGAILDANICCKVSIEQSVERETQEETCDGAVIAEDITKEKRLINIEFKEIDNWSLAIYAGATPSFKRAFLTEEINTYTLSTNGQAVIGANRVGVKVMVGKETLQRVHSLSNLDYNQFVYDPTTGTIYTNATIYGNKVVTIFAGVEKQRLVLSEKPLASGQQFYFELPEYQEDKVYRTIAGYAKMTEFTMTNNENESANYKISFNWLPSEKGTYDTYLSY